MLDIAADTFGWLISGLVAAVFVGFVAVVAWWMRK